MDLTAPAASRDAPRPGGGAYLCPWLMSPSLARGQVTPLVSQRGQGDARPARYGQKRCRYTRSMTAGNQSASWRAGTAGHPAPSAALRCALGPALSASGTGRTWCTTRAARRPGQPNGTWPGRCWPGRAVALRGIEPVHSLGRRPSREHGRHHALWDGSQERTQLRRSGRVATPQRSPAEARRSGCSVLQHRPDLPTSGVTCPYGYALACMHIVNGCSDRQFGLVARIWARLPIRHGRQQRR